MQQLQSQPGQMQPQQMPQQMLQQMQLMAAAPTGPAPAPSPEPRRPTRPTCGDLDYERRLEKLLARLDSVIDAYDEYHSAHVPYKPWVRRGRGESGGIAWTIDLRNWPRQG
mmetsp:Transcript_28930/g.86093  ORF Transcript_28930/g.86093 Transcript_28930/m.86093 type:complete len:111 (+) Transcript_28930:190-522(+)